MDKSYFIIVENVNVFLYPITLESFFAEFGKRIWSYNLNLVHKSYFYYGDNKKILINKFFYKVVHIIC
jgi:hypothetical protein